MRFGLKKPTRGKRSHARGSASRMTEGRRRIRPGKDVFSTLSSPQWRMETSRASKGCFATNVAGCQGGDRSRAAEQIQRIVRLYAASASRHKCAVSLVLHRYANQAGAVRLIAGPGTGKSSTIEERVSWLLQQNVPPAQIAVISFTNASVVDLRLRLHAYCHSRNQQGINEVSISTLHSLALRLLRQAHLLENHPTRPLVLDDWELEHSVEHGSSECADISACDATDNR